MLVSGDAGLGPAPVPQPDDPIKLITAQTEVNFPREVIFQLEAEAEQEITDITLFYRLGNQPVITYAYPDFEPSTQVTTDLHIKTDGSSYIPAGVDIEYYYVIGDATGRRLQSEPFTLTYLDRRYGWEDVRLENLIVTYHDRSREDVLGAASQVNLLLEDVKDLMGLESVRPMKAVILNDLREADRSFPLISQTARNTHTFGGFAYGEYDLFVLVGLGVGGMVHEMTHLLIDEALDSPLAKMPAWLNEGLAMYFEPGSYNARSAMERAARDDRLVPLRSMYQVPGRPRDVAHFYSQARNVVTYLIDQEGADRMSALLRAINDGERIEDAVETAYGMSLDLLESRWQAWLLGEPLPEPEVVPDEMPITVPSEPDAAPPPAPAVAQASDDSNLAFLVGGTVAVLVAAAGASLAYKLFLHRTAGRGD